MTDTEILRLVERDSRVDLSGLESDIWAREANIRGTKIVTRRLLSWQAAVMTFAIIGSAVAGSAFAVNSTKHQNYNMLLGTENLAPSSLLFGVRR